MTLQGIKLITFDATNTLLKFKMPPWLHYVAMASNYGIIVKEEDVKKGFAKGYETMWREYPNFGKNKITWEEWWRRVVKLTYEGQLPKDADVDNIATELINKFKTAKCWCTADDGDTLLKLIRERNICVGIISNFDPRLSDILKDVSMYKKFDFILTSYEVGYAKPDERIFNHALKECKRSVQPYESLHVGDDLEKDYKGARAAGWHAVLITDSLKTEKPPAPEHVFKNLKQFSLALTENTIQF